MHELRKKRVSGRQKREPRDCIPGEHAPQMDQNAPFPLCCAQTPCKISPQRINPRHVRKSFVRHFNSKRRKRGAYSETNNNKVPGRAVATEVGKNSHEYTSV